MTVVTAPPLPMTVEQRHALEKLARSTTAGHRKVVQAKALLLAADGVGTNEVARRCHTTNDSVRAWRRRFASEGVEGVGRIAPGRGRRSWLPEGTVAVVVHDTLHKRPDDESTHWTTRLMAERFGIGKDTVARIWRDHNLKPWKVATFKVSNDPRFEEKLVDVVGLYLNPPERAIVFSFDEKTQVQALDRTQPSLPLRAGRSGTVTHDYKRNGTTDLFAGLNVTTGEGPFRHEEAAHCQRRSLLLQVDRPPCAEGPRHPRRVGQSLRPQGTDCCQVAGPSQASSVAPALHPDQFLVAEPRRGLVLTAHRATAPARHVQLGRPSHRGDRDMGRALERRSEALRLAQIR
jgi:transposase